jgi:hypothetical protein
VLFSYFGVRPWFNEPDVAAAGAVPSLKGHMKTGGTCSVRVKVRLSPNLMLGSEAETTTRGRG